MYVGIYSVVIIVYAFHIMKKKLYKIKIWERGDCNLLQETDRQLTDDEANNFKVAKQFRGTIEEIKEETPKPKTQQILGTTITINS